MTHEARLVAILRESPRVMQGLGGLEAEGGMSVAAQFGLDDLFAMRLLPNPDRPFRAEAFAGVTASAKALWPQAHVETP